MIGAGLMAIGLVFLWFALIGALSDLWRWRQGRELNQRFRENQRLWRHG